MAWLAYHYGLRPRWKKIFFGRNNKNRWSAFRKFLFYQNIICFDWVMIFFLSSLQWCFLSKKCHFQLKQLCLKKKLANHLSYKCCNDLNIYKKMNRNLFLLKLLTRENQTLLLESFTDIHLRILLTLIAITWTNY